MKKLFLLIVGIFAFGAMMAQNANLQIIHNSPSPTVDVYVNGVKTLTDFEFRTATDFLEVPAGVDLQIDVAPAPSADVSESIFTQTVNLDADINYVAIAQGAVGDMNRPFGLALIGNALTASPNPATVALNVVHGGQDAPNVDVTPRGAGMPLIADLAFGENTGYVELPEDKYLLDILVAGTQNVAGSYVADINGLAGGAGVVLASGYLDPSLGDGFGLFLALPSGGDLVELPVEEFANVQIIHNSPEPTVDIWLNGNKAIENFEFRTATGFLELTAGFDIEIGVAPSPSDDPSDIIFTETVNLQADENYVALAQGALGNMMRPFQLNIIADAQTASGNNQIVALNIAHGGVDAPAVDVAARGATDPIAENLAFSENTGYINFPPQTFILDVFATGADTPVATFLADASALGGGAAIVFASGYIDPALGPAFGLFAALPDGTVIQFDQAEFATWQIIHNSPGTPVDVYIDDNLALDDYAYTVATNTALVPAGVDIKLDIAPANSTSSADAIFTETVNFENFKNYVVFAEGIVGDPDAPFGLSVSDRVQLNAQNPNNAELLIHHGSPDAPAIDIGERNGDLLLTDLEFRETADAYASLEARNYFITLYPTGTQDEFKTYQAGLTGAEGLVATVYATGLVGSTEPAEEFRLILVLSNGQSIALPEVGFSNVQILHNSPDPAVDIFIDGVKALSDVAFRTATPPIEFLSDVDIEVGIAPAGGTINDVIFSTTVSFEKDENYLVAAEGIVGDANTPFNLNVIDDYRFESQDPASVDILALHGSPDAPEVDVLANGNSFVEDIEFGESAGYLSVAPANYELSVTPSQDNTTVVARYLAELENAAGAAVTVFASGLLNGTPEFGLWALLADGTTFPLPLISSTVERVEDNIDLRVGPNPASTFGMIHFSEAMDVNRIDLVTIQGQVVRNYQEGQLEGYSGAYKFDLNGIPSGSYVLRIMSNDKTYVSRLSVIK
ncbi:MAG TPA: DUF4397 domain-containing protein [Saprospiraceae bacterium]|nr:DUF4397 domain-containing protein [Saprospiraceae bacterium]